MSKNPHIIFDKAFLQQDAERQTRRHEREQAEMRRQINENFVVQSRVWAMRQSDLNKDGHLSIEEYIGSLHGNIQQALKQHLCYQTENYPEFNKQISEDNADELTVKASKIAFPNGVAEITIENICEILLPPTPAEPQDNTKGPQL